MSTEAKTIDDGNKPRAAIVTGASRGLGRAIAIQLAEDGFDIALNSLPHSLDKLKEVAQIIEQKGRRAITISGDITDETFVQELVDRTVAELGELYVMVANAGIGPGTLLSSIVNTSFSSWKKVMEVNLDGKFLCYRAAARQMLKQGRGGRIIGAASLGSKQAIPFFGSYSSSKFGVRGLTQVLAGELAISNITVNAYAPGPVDTDIWNGVKLEGQEETLLEKQAPMVPMKRLCSAEEVAGLVSYLVSDKASFITGQTIVMSGGVLYD